jgi:iron complex outermembrane receptor protein
LKLFGSLRVDYNTEFTPKFNPRFAAVYTIAQKHNIRFSIQNGYRFPALFEALSFVNNGNVRRVGGLSFINDGLGYLDNSYTLASVNQFNAAYNQDRNPALPSGQIDQQAALKNRALLEITNLSPTRPEKIVSFELGYKSVLLNNKLVLDYDAYLNKYDGFLGQVEVAVPTDGTVGTNASVIDMVASNRAKQTRYRVFTNAKKTYTNYGTAIGITYNFYQKFTFTGNINYNNIVANKTADIFITAFNTPNWVVNFSIGNREIVKNLGFNIVWRWQDGFKWESPLANGSVPAYQVVDAQVNYRIPRAKTTIKIGGANIFNNRYIQYAAGPTIGGLYYAAITLEGLLNK